MHEIEPVTRTAIRSFRGALLATALGATLVVPVFGPPALAKALLPTFMAKTSWYLMAIPSSKAT